ncbi:MAG: hypothetical protein ACOCWO_04765, partial [Candidatus Muiribacteriaceae bacterium]
MAVGILWIFRNIILSGIGGILLHEDKADQTVDVIIVCGGGTYKRAEKALELYRQNMSGNIILTGDKLFWPDTDMGWDDMAEHYLVERGVNE